MYYACIENNIITSILNYRPNVPETIKIVELSEEDHKQIVAGTKKYDAFSNSFVSVTNQKSAADVAADKKKYLASTDWMVLRHLREKALGEKTSLSEQEYLNLESERQAIAQSI